MKARLCPLASWPKIGSQDNVNSGTILRPGSFRTEHPVCTEEAQLMRRRPVS